MARKALSKFQSPSTRLTWASVWVSTNLLESGSQGGTCKLIGLRLGLRQKPTVVVHTSYVLSRYPLNMPVFQIFSSLSNFFQDVSNFIKMFPIFSSCFQFFQVSHKNIRSGSCNRTHRFAKIITEFWTWILSILFFL